MNSKRVPCSPSLYLYILLARFQSISQTKIWYVLSFYTFHLRLPSLPARSNSLSKYLYQFQRNLAHLQHRLSGKSSKIPFPLNARRYADFTLTKSCTHSPCASGPRHQLVNRGGGNSNPIFTASLPLQPDQLQRLDGTLQRYSTLVSIGFRLHSAVGVGL